MKKYNVENYVRYKEDLKLSMPEGLFWDEYTREENFQLHNKLLVL